MLHYGGKLSAKGVCTLAWWSSRAGALGRLSELGFRPDSQSGKFQRHLDAVLGLKGLGSEYRYHVDIPQHSKHDQSRHVRETPVLPAHEALHEEIEQQPQILQQVPQARKTAEWSDPRTPR